MYRQSKAKNHEEYVSEAPQARRKDLTRRLSDLDETTLRELIRETADGDFGM